MVTATSADRKTFSTQEAADFLGVSQWLILELVKRGELPSLRLGRRIVVPRAALDQMLESATRRERPRI